MSSADRPAQTLGFLLKRAQHAFRTRVDDALRPLALTAPQFAVLAAVDAVAGISNAELARVAFVTPQTMQGILANLERAGLLTRSPHPQNARILRSTLSTQGIQLLGRARLRVQEVERLLTEAVGQEHVPDFAHLLSRCSERLDAD